MPDLTQFVAIDDIYSHLRQLDKFLADNLWCGIIVSATPLVAVVNEAAKLLEPVSRRLIVQLVPFLEPSDIYRLDLTTSFAQLSNGTNGTDGEEVPCHSALAATGGKAKTFLSLKPPHK